ncbi:hypothetical protein [Hoeflea sp.]|uniref:hypothetical protein n=1 Tax=Hoeflea sp. TaxID=1940281 RepID=UPI003B02D48C
MRSAPFSSRETVNPMADIIQLSSRSTARRPRRLPKNHHRDGATVLLFTGVRYEQKDGRKQLIAERKRGSKG